MAEQVRADYDFEAQAGSGELNLKTGEVLTVIRKVNYYSLIIISLIIIC